MVKSINIFHVLIQDEWSGLTMDDIRDFERRTAEELKRKMRGEEEEDGDIEDAITEAGEDLGKSFNSSGGVVTSPQPQQVPHLVNTNLRENAQQQLYTVSQTGTEWTHSWWECGGDLKICLCGTFCPCCMICSNARSLGRSGLAYNILACIVPCIPMFLLRQEASRQFGIRSEVGRDKHLEPSYNCGHLAA